MIRLARFSKKLVAVITVAVAVGAPVLAVLDVDIRIALLLAHFQGFVPIIEERITLVVLLALEFTRFLMRIRDDVETS